ncbi:MAG: hypothetical protein QM610_14355 [Chitinophagaceae bacterium]
MSISLEWTATIGGTSQAQFSWQLFSDVFGTLHDQFTAAHPDKAIDVGELGCTSTGSDKAAWITDMFTSIPNRFPKLKFFVWFNINKETDWRFTSDEASINAFKAGLQKNYMVYGKTRWAEW